MRPSSLTRTSADADARNGARLVLLGVVLLIATIPAIGVAPQRWRAGVLVAGLSTVAVVSIWGGLLARRGLAEGTSFRTRAFAGAVLGFLVGLTAGLMAIWSLVGVVS